MKLIASKTMTVLTLLFFSLSYFPGSTAFAGDMTPPPADAPQPVIAAPPQNANATAPVKAVAVAVNDPSTTFFEGNVLDQASDKDGDAESATPAEAPKPAESPKLENTVVTPAPLEGKVDTVSADDNFDVESEKVETTSEESGEGEPGGGERLDDGLDGAQFVFAEVPGENPRNAERQRAEQAELRRQAAIERERLGYENRFTQAMQRLENEIASMDTHIANLTTGRQTIVTQAQAINGTLGATNQRLMRLNANAIQANPAIQTNINELQAELLLLGKLDAYYAALIARAQEMKTALEARLTPMRTAGAAVRFGGRAAVTNYQLDRLTAQALQVVARSKAFMDTDGAILNGGKLRVDRSFNLARARSNRDDVKFNDPAFPGQYVFGILGVSRFDGIMVNGTLIGRTYYPVYNAQDTRTKKWVWVNRNIMGLTQQLGIVTRAIATNTNALNQILTQLGV